VAERRDFADLVEIFLAGVMAGAPIISALVDGVSLGAVLVPPDMMSVL